MRRNPSFDGHQRALNLATRADYVRVKDCDRCGHAIAFFKSSKSGKWYAANVVAKQSLEDGRDLDTLRAAPWWPHRCQEFIDQDAALARAFDTERG